MQQPAILSVFSIISSSVEFGQTHLALCLALFTMAVVAGNQDFSRFETGSTAIKVATSNRVRVAFEKSIPLNSAYFSFK